MTLLLLVMAALLVYVRSAARPADRHG
jgi:hypothetical protein